MDSTNQIKDVSILNELFQHAGVGEGKKVVTYCHIGQQASLVCVAAMMLGYDASVYDGSFEDWSWREDLPVENPANAVDRK